MCKGVYSVCVIMFVSFLGLSQIPAGYYSGTNGLTGYALKTKLFQITGNGYISHSYGDLWDAYQTTDRDYYYENDATILDMYSENPNGLESYEFTYSNDQCGNYSGEGSCYNREHLVPQSWFNEAQPMKADVHHIFPTDGYVNNRRSNHPFGEVNNPTWTSTNGSKLGPNVYNYSGAFSGTVFEPIDEFKGDIARAYFYMATRYENKVGNWASSGGNAAATFDGSFDHVFTNWILDMFLKWNQEDPVSQKEIDRNNAAYVFQGNRNPFIDHPEYAADIWGNNSGGGGPTDPPITQDSTVLFNEDFEVCNSVSNHFTIINELSAQNWHCTTSLGENGSKAISMYGFDGTQQVSSVDWLISNPINFNLHNHAELSFFASAYQGNTALQLLFSTDYQGYGNPSDYTWQPVPNFSIPLYNSSTNDTVDYVFSEIDLSGIVGNSVRLAFKYDNAHGTQATLWSVDNFILKDIPQSTNNLNAVDVMDVLIYPNPSNATDGVTVQLSQSYDFSYTILSLTGQVIKTGKSFGESKVKISDFKKGWYIVKVRTSSSVFTQSIIIQ